MFYFFKKNMTRVNLCLVALVSLMVAQSNYGMDDKENINPNKRIARTSKFENEKPHKKQKLNKNQIKDISSNFKISESFLENLPEFKDKNQSLLKNTVTIAVLNTALLTETRQADGENVSPFDVLYTPKKKAFIKKYKLKEEFVSNLAEDVNLLKQTYPKPVVNFDNPAPFSPILLKSVSRITKKEYKDTGLTQSIKDQLFYENEKELTEDEILEMKALREAIFLAVELKNGNTPQILKTELDFEYAIWKPYMDYFNARKEDIRRNGAPKIRRDEIKTVFEYYLVPYMKSIIVDGYTVFYLPQSIKMNRCNGVNIDTKSLMPAGKNPIGPDMMPLNYHHLDHYDFKAHKTECTIVLISCWLHKTYHTEIHFEVQGDFRLPLNLGHPEFDDYRESFNRKIYKEYNSII